MLDNIRKYSKYTLKGTNDMASFLNGTHIDNLCQSGVYSGDLVRREPRSRTDAHH